MISRRWMTLFLLFFIFGSIFAQSEESNSQYGLLSKYSIVTVFQTVGQETIFKAYTDISPFHAVESFADAAHHIGHSTSFSIDSFFVVFGSNTIPLFRPSNPNWKEPAPPGTRLGVSLQESLGTRIRKALNIPVDTPGVLVINVYSHTPAERAGLKVKDFIISFNGKIIQNGADLVTAVKVAESNKKIPIVIYRNGKKRILHVKF